MYHAIEYIGFGKARRYTIKMVLENGTVVPTNGKVYKTEAAAERAAHEMNLSIAKRGDFYAII